MVLKYNGFIGSIDYSGEDDMLFGEILYIDDLVTYEGKDLDELKKNFKEAIDEYIELCKKHNKEPERSVSV